MLLPKNTKTNYSKLVRDKIPEIIAQDGRKADVEIAHNNNDFQMYLSKKLVEESQEFVENQNPQELADVLEVLLTILHLKKMSFTELEKERLVKREARGGFEKRIILKSTSD